MYKVSLPWASQTWGLFALRASSLHRGRKLLRRRVRCCGMPPSRLSLASSWSLAHSLTFAGWLQEFSAFCFYDCGTHGQRRSNGDRRNDGDRRHVRAAERGALTLERGGGGYMRCVGRCCWVWPDALTVALRPLAHFPLGPARRGVVCCWRGCAACACDAAFR